MTTGEHTFYVIGGTLRADSPSYVERQADRDLIGGLLAGEFCYALTSRQMGKSSLMVRTANRLRAAGIKAVVLDLTAVGQNVTPEQWYDGLLARMGRQMRLENEVEDFWRRHGNLGPCQRFFAALEQVVLQRLIKECATVTLSESEAPFSPRLVIFVDELDVVQSLPFSTDEFFAAIRECYTRRAQEFEFSWLTFCLLGVATPSDLIRNTRLTPFNVGQRIELNDFTPEEAAPLCAGLRAGTRSNAREVEVNSELLLARILYWTNGHPYLTQRLCGVVLQALKVHAEPVSALNPHGAEFVSRFTGEPNARWVDQLCDEIFLSSRARDRDDNLIFVRERLLRSGVDRAGLLDLYNRIRRRQDIRHDDTDPLMNALRLTGVVRLERGKPRVRNRIYERVFDQAWILANMPDAELRRQKSAFWRGVIRATVVGMMALAVLIGLVVFAHRQSNESRERLIRLNVSTGIRHMEEQDLLGAFPWFVEALRLEQEHGSPAREQIERARLAAIMREAPRPTQLWFHGGAITHIEFSSDGHLLLVVSQDGKCVLRDVTTGDDVCPALSSQSEVSGASFDANAQRVVCVVGASGVRVWSVQEGRALGSTISHTNTVLMAKLSPDGHQVVTACNDGYARLWDVETGRELFKAKHPAAVIIAAFSPDGSRIVTVDEGARVWIRDARTGEPLTNPLLHNDTVFDVAFSPDSRRLATACRDGTAQVLDVVSGKRIGPAFRHNARVTSVAFSPNSRLLLTTSYDLTARVWDTETGLPVTPPLKHAHSVGRGNFDPDGRQVITASFDQTARVWDIATGEPVLSPFRHRGYVSQAMFSPEGDHIVTAGQDGVVRLWDVTGSLSPVRALEYKHQTFEVAFSSDSKRVVGGSADQQAVVWDVATGASVTSVRHQGWANSVQFSTDGKRLLTGSRDFTARIWNAETGAPLIPPVEHKGEVHSARFSPDETCFVTASDDRTGRVWDAATGKAVTPPLEHDDIVNWAAFSPDGRWVATASEDASARVWDARSGGLLATLKHDSPVVHLSFSPDGRKLATACSDPSYAARAGHIWDWKAHQEIVPPLAHGDGVYEAIFSPDGRYVATASEDATACIWQTETGKLAAPPLQHRHQVRWVAFSPDGTRLLTVSRDKTARVWDVLTGDPITPPLRHSSECNFGVISPDGRSIAISTMGGNVRLWEMPTEPRSIKDLLLVSELLSGRRLDPLAGPVALPSRRLAETWEGLRSRYPRDFVVTLDQRANWHRNELDLCLKAKSWSAAVFHLNSLVRAEPNVWQHYLRRAQVYHELNESDLALTDVSKALEFMPDDGEALKLRGHLYELHFHEPDRAKQDFVRAHREALEHYSEAISKNPADPEMHRQRGAIYEQTREFSLAIYDYGEALRNETNAMRRSALYEDRAKANSELGQHASAMADLEKCLDLDAENASAGHRLAWIYLIGPIGLRNPARALVLAEKAMELDRFNSAYLMALGAANYRLGQYATALDLLENAVRYRREGAAGFDLFLMAMARAQLGEWAKAQQQYEQAMNWLKTQSHLTSRELEELELFQQEAKALLRSGGKT